MGLAPLPPPGSAGHAPEATYEEPAWFSWGTAALDILVVPPSHGQLVNANGVLNGLDPAELTPLNSYLAAIRAALRAWQEAIAAYGAPWLRDGVALRWYVVGLDDVPPEALADPEVLVVTDETKAEILGVAVRVTRDLCVVDVSKLYKQSLGEADMFNVLGHEVGHCLGADHVVGNQPAHDLMAGSYPHYPGAAGTHRHCPSNLNVRTLERVFGGLFGEPSGGVASMAAEAYATGC